MEIKLKNIEYKKDVKFALIFFHIDILRKSLAKCDLVSPDSRE